MTNNWEIKRDGGIICVLRRTQEDMAIQQTWHLPQKIKEQAEKYFNPSLVNQATSLLQQSKVAISFSSGRDPEQFFVVSGIVQDRGAKETKVSFKKRLEDSTEGPLTSNCTCNQWAQGKHCSHSAALFLFFKLQQAGEESMAETYDENSPPIALNASFGVTPEEYGTIVGDPQQLVGAPPASTYSSMQYLLSSKKITHFPIPKDFVGKLIVSIENPKLSSAAMMIHDFMQDLPPEEQLNFFARAKFSYLKDNAEEEKKINLFEALYLFNWKSGEAFHLPSQLQNFVRQLKNHRHNISANGILELADEISSEYLEVRIQERPLHEIPQVQTHAQVNLMPSTRKGHLDIEIIFVDENQQKLALPEVLSDFTFTGGNLACFRTKSDTYEFLDHLIKIDEFEDTSYKRMLVGGHDRSKWLKTIERLFHKKHSIIYDTRLKKIINYDHHLLKKIILSFIKNFTAQSFRFSTYEQEAKQVTLTIATSQVFQGLNTFNQEMSLYGVTVYYDRKEIAKWQSRVRFERRESSNKWFDLELNLTDQDLEIIKKSNLETGLAVTKKGLVLLTNEQKDLVRFMKKYTKYEVIQDEDASSKQELEDDHKKFILPFNRARIFELFELRKLGVDGALKQEEIELCERLIHLEEIPQYPMSERLSEIMRPYQKTGHHWLRFLYENKLGACLADDMGLGKTLQAISFLTSIIDQVDQVLIVCPVSILLNWEQEFKKFSDLEIQIYHGGEREFDPSRKITLTSYGVMKKEADGVFSDHHFDILILDEVQHLKNVRSLGAFSARKIQADFRICLTGTPVENDLSEFYNILDLSVPGIWGDLQFIRTTSNQKTRLLARKTASPFILRRTKAQVLTDLPPKTEHNAILEMVPEERERYVMSLKQIKQAIDSTQKARKYGEILKGLLTLRQLCLWQTKDKSTNHHYNNIQSTKIDYLIEMLEQILEEGHQAIVFSQFTTYLNIIQQYIEQKHWKYSRIDGSQSIKKRQNQVELFQSRKNPIFLISLKAGGVGLNLTAASYVFIMDPWWNPAVEQQAIDRAHRIGQSNPLNVYRPIIKNTVEEKVLELQKIKRELFYELLPDDDETMFAGKLTMKDFEHLFN